MHQKTNTIIPTIGLFFLLASVSLTSGCVSDKSLTQLTPRWALPPSTFIEVNGMKVHVRDEGPRDDPQPLVLLHGTSASLHTWEGWVKALKDQHRVITLDMPGFGLTGPFLTDDYSMQHYVVFLNQTLKQLQVRQYSLVGNSLGGGIAWHMALAYPDQVKKLILVDATGYMVKPKSTPIGFRIAKIPVLNKVMEFTLPRRVVESSVRAVYADPSKVSEELVERYYDLTLRTGNRRALVERFKQAPSGADSDAIQNIKTPTLILWGKQDQLIPVENAARFHKDIQGSQIRIFEGLGHVPHEEDPVQTAEAARSFLNQ